MRKCENCFNGHYNSNPGSGDEYLYCDEDIAFEEEVNEDDCCENHRYYQGTEELDQNERDKNHLLNAERAYMEVAKKYDFYTIECNDGSRIKPIEEINDELYEYVKKELVKKKWYYI